MDEEIEKTYGNRVRVRVCGLCWQADELLMVNHAFQDGDFWAVPGGGVDFGERLEMALTREFAEETGFIIAPGRFLFGCEFIKLPLHGIELFYEAKILTGELTVGNDPELPLIKDVEFMSNARIYSKPANQRHGIFNVISNLSELHQLKGFYYI